MVFGISATLAGVEEGGGDERGITPLGYLGGGGIIPLWISRGWGNTLP